MRSLRSPYRLVQTLLLRDLHILVATEAGLVACTDTSIYRLLPVAISVQVRGVLPFFSRLLGKPPGGLELV